MLEGNARLVKALYWFVNDELEPLALNLGDAKFLCFFSTRWNAETFKQGQAMPPGRWTMLSTESAVRAGKQRGLHRLRPKPATQLRRSGQAVDPR